MGFCWFFRELMGSFCLPFWGRREQRELTATLTRRTDVMTGYVETGGLRVAEVLYRFINEEALPGTGIDRDAFWADFGAIVADFAPRNRALLNTRDAIQEKLDAWHRDCHGQAFDAEAQVVQLKNLRLQNRIALFLSLGGEFTIGEPN